MAVNSLVICMGTALYSPRQTFPLQLRSSAILDFPAEVALRVSESRHNTGALDLVAGCWDSLPHSLEWKRQ